MVNHAFYTVSKYDILTTVCTVRIGCCIVTEMNCKIVRTIVTTAGLNQRGCVRLIDCQLLSVVSVLCQVVACIIAYSVTTAPIRKTECLEQLRVTAIVPPQTCTRVQKSTVLRIVNQIRPSRCIEFTRTCLSSGETFSEIGVFKRQCTQRVTLRGDCHCACHQQRTKRCKNLFHK